MLGLDPWRTESEGVLSSETGEFRLRIQKRFDCAIFMELQRSGHARADPLAVIASGTKGDVRAAMKAAEKAAERLQALQTLNVRVGLDAGQNRSSVS